MSGFPVNDQTLYMAKKGHWPCKLGTMPAVVTLHASDIRRIEPGNWVRVKERGREKMPWTRVLVQSVLDDGSLHFQADR